jgi:hypothetical protein
MSTSKGKQRARPTEESSDDEAFASEAEQALFLTSDNENVSGDEGSGEGEDEEHNDSNDESSSPPLTKSSKNKKPPVRATVSQWASSKEPGLLDASALRTVQHLVSSTKASTSNLKAAKSETNAGLRKANKASGSSTSAGKKRKGSASNSVAAPVSTQNLGDKEILIPCRCLNLSSSHPSLS